MIFVSSYRFNVPSNAIDINSTSRSINWTRGLSPFTLGPINLYEHEDEILTAKNVENAWQFSKVYKEHISDGIITDKYWQWAKDGWKDTYAHRYPMGRGKKPEFSLWEGDRLSYIEARKRIYIPIYSQAVKKSFAFQNLLKIHKQADDAGKDIYIRDFDGYNHKDINMSYNDVINCESRKMGHGFVIAMLLDGFLKI